MHGATISFYALNFDKYDRPVSFAIACNKAFLTVRIHVPVYSLSQIFPPQTYKDNFFPPKCLVFFETFYASSHYTLHILYLLVTIFNMYRAKQNIPLYLSHFQLIFAGPKSILLNGDGPTILSPTRYKLYY